METPTELARKIRFALDEMSRENGHRAFEDLCRELARARVVSNILPATGPVAGGGDQGRDFETFRTYLAGSLRFSRGFIGLASPGTVVFACSPAREGVAHPRVWLNPGPGTGYLAVVTETGAARSATESAGRIWAMLAGRFATSSRSGSPTDEARYQASRSR